MAYFRCSNGNPPPAPTPSENECVIAEWDFTKSLIDTIGNREMVLTDVTRDSQGIHLTEGTSKATVPDITFFAGMYLEFETGDLDPDFDTSKHASLLTFKRSSTNCGLFYRNNGSNDAWSIYGGNTWKDTSFKNVTDLINKKIKLYAKNVSSLCLLIDDVEVATTSQSAASMDNAVNICFGNTYNTSGNTSFNNAIIKNLKIGWVSPWEPVEQGGND